MNNVVKDHLMLQLNFKPFPELETQRLRLRKVKKEDADELFFLRSDEAVLRYLGKAPARSMKEIKEFLRSVRKSMEANDSVLWGIALKEFPSKLIGTICFWNIQKHNYRSEIGYVLNPQHWHKGIMKETINKVLEYGFNSMGLHSIEARLRPGNMGSIAVLESTGFVKEGYLKQDCYYNGNFFDTLIYSRLQPSLPG